MPTSNLSYPGTIKYIPDMEGFRVLEQNNPPLMTEFEDGPMLGRKARIGRRAKVSYRIKFPTAAQYEIFRQFVEYTLVDGSQRFNMPVWIPATNGYANRVVQIDRGSVTADPWGLGWQVSFTLYIYDW